MAEETISVLLIEDNAGDRRLVEAALADAEDVRFEVMAVDRLATAIQRLAAGGVDVVLLDLGLPDSLGLDSFTSIHEQQPDVPVVVLSGLDHQGVAAEAVRAGARHYLVKSRLLEENLDRIILRAMSDDAAPAGPDELAAEAAPPAVEEEERGEPVLPATDELQPADEPDAAHVMLLALSGDYRSLALDYSRAVRNDEPRPTQSIESMARRIARTGASGHQVLTLHQSSLQEDQGQPYATELNEAGQVMLVELLACLADEYTK